MKRLIGMGIFFVLFCGVGFSYFLGIKSADNTIGNIQAIEETYGVYIPLVSFIFDERGEEEQETVAQLSSTLGTGRIYHITLSPKKYTAKQVALGYYDEEYRSFFRLVQEQDLLVVFRTMHEMNGGWYPWSSDPESFQKAWIHIWDISREVGLDTHNVIFSFSSNHWDAPTTEHNANKQSEIFFCTPAEKIRTGCFTFEDYYPGDAYVDLMGVSFYNRGKATYDRKRLAPRVILEDPERDTLTRLQQFHKPIIVDEVATTAVYYTGRFHPAKSLAVYTTGYAAKNAWLLQLQKFLSEEKSIVAAVYFNADFTKGLTRAPVGEADWAIMNLHPKKIYFAAHDLFAANETTRANGLLRLFGVVYLDHVRVYQEDVQFVEKFRALLEKKYPDSDQRMKILSALQEKILSTSSFSEEQKRIWQRRFETIRKYIFFSCHSHENGNPGNESDSCSGSPIKSGMTGSV